jgi:serine/threonine-protein kinase
VLGSEIAGYLIESELGRGGMGVVYLAYDPRLKRRVALKLVAPPFARGIGLPERFMHESELAASLDHPNVVPIYEAGEAGGRLFIAMRYVEGTDLRALLREGPLPPKRTLELVSQVASALDAAHARGLVHRDVKPSNVLVDATDHVYLADFGLTRRMREPKVAEDGLVGTIEYVAAEQIRGAEVDGRADVYSLGCVLYECLAGRPPFAHDSDVAVLFAHLASEPPTLPGLEAVLQKALAKDPAERFDSCGALVEAATTAMGLVRPGRRQRYLAGVVVVCAAAAGTTLALLLQQGGLPTSAAGPRGALVRVDGASGAVGRRLRLGEQLTGVAAGAGAVWLSDAGSAALLRVSQGVSAVQTIPAEGSPAALAADGGWVATANDSNGTVAVFDAATGDIHTIAHVSTAGVQAVCDVALAGSSAWATDCLNSRIVQFDLQTGAIERAVRLVPQAEDESTADRLFAGIAIGDGSIWVAGDLLDPTVYRIGLHGVVARIRVPAGTDGIAVGAGAVWLTNQLTDQLVRVDPRSNRVTATIPVGREPVAVALSGDTVWTANALDRTLSQINVPNDRVVRTLRLDATPVALAADARGLWVAEQR